MSDQVLYAFLSFVLVAAFTGYIVGVTSKKTKVVMKDDDLDRIARSLAARLSDEPVKFDDGEMDKFAYKCAVAWNEIPYDNSPDDAMFDRIREMVENQTDRFAAKVMELADQRRAERERAKAEQAEIVRPTSATLEGFQVVGPAVPVETSEPVEFGVGDRVDVSCHGLGNIEMAVNTTDGEPKWKVNFDDGGFAFPRESLMTLVEKAQPATA